MKNALWTLLLCLSSSFQLGQAAHAANLPPLAPPPVRGSVEDQRDFDELFLQQASRTQEDCARAAYEEDASLAHLFGPPYGPLNPLEIALFADSFDQLFKKVNDVVQIEKKSWGRLRPYAEDTRIVPCLRKETSNAYPSGHATISEFFAEVLLRIYPDRDPAVFFSRAHQVGDDRVLAGLHHPTDIVAGRQLADELFTEWLKDPQFAAQLEQLIQLRATNGCKSL